MPVHEIEMTIPVKSVRNADTEVVVKAGGRKIGSLHLSQHAIVWDPASRSESITLSWDRFSEVMAGSRRSPAEEAPAKATRRRGGAQAKPAVAAKAPVTTKAPAVRKAGTGAPRRGRSAGKAVDASVVREWAKSNGMAVSERGRLRADVVAAYRKAN